MAQRINPTPESSERTSERAYLRGELDDRYPHDAGSSSGKGSECAGSPEETRYCRLDSLNMTRCMCTRGEGKCEA